MAEAIVTVIVPPSEITEATLPAFEQTLRAHLEADAGGLVVDLESVEFISSAGLGALVKVGMRLDARGHRLALARARRAPEHSIQLLGLDRKMPLFPTVEAARGYVSTHDGAG